jgi:hypothetical protein
VTGSALLNHWSASNSGAGLKELMDISVKLILTLLVPDLVNSGRTDFLYEYLNLVCGPIFFQYSMKRRFDAYSIFLISRANCFGPGHAQPTNEPDTFWRSSNGGRSTTVAGRRHLFAQ